MSGANGFGGQQTQRNRSSIHLRLRPPVLKKPAQPFDPTTAGSTSFTYDANGHLTGDGTWVYTYDAENRLTHATGAGKDVTLSYDPLGRLYFVGGSNVGDVTFLYDGDALVEEYNSAGTMTNRYVHGSNAAADDPLVWYIGSAVGSSNRRYLHADHEGSIVATSDGSGLIANINTYDEYGIPGSGNDSRFGYTGQEVLVLVRAIA